MIISKTNKILIIIALLIIVVIAVATCLKKPSNQTIDSNIGTVKQKTEHIQLNDSTTGARQDVLITTDPTLINHLVDSITQVFNKKIGLNAQGLIQSKQSVLIVKDTSKINSLSKAIDSLLAQQKDSNITPEQFEQFKKDLYNTTIPFKKDGKYFYQAGHIDYNGNLVIDTFKLDNQSIIEWGEVKKNFLSRPKITAFVRNTNPLVATDSLKSIIYTPKTKTQISIGPMAIGNKTSLSVGAGIFIKRGFFSIGLGYQFYNHKF